jgi:hypothetical protein
MEILRDSQTTLKLEFGTGSQTYLVGAYEVQTSGIEKFS